MARTILHNDERGFVIAEGNELTIGSKIDDPPKLRLTYPISSSGGGGGAISYNASTSAGTICWGSDQHEMAMDRVEQASDVRGNTANLKAERNFLLNDGSGSSDSAMQKPLSFIWNAITKILLPLTGGGGGSSNFVQSDNGRFRLYVQGDGNLVLYDVSTAPWTAMWNTGTVVS